MNRARKVAIGNARLAMAIGALSPVPVTNSHPDPLYRPSSGGTPAQRLLERQRRQQLAGQIAKTIARKTVSKKS